VGTACVEINPELCKDCQLCISICPEQLISLSDQLNQKGYRPVQFVEKQTKKEERKSKGCCLCAVSCSEIAIELYRG
jgi:2-oxoglutarate ferredoxin oxidoreductase subunit delta